jgi:hypothetical protein
MNSEFINVVKTLPLRSFIAGLIAVLLQPGSAFAAGDDVGEHAIPHHWVAASAGYALERKRDKDKEAGVVGVEYGYRFAEHWGIGAVVEWVSSDTARDVAVAVPVSFHPHAGWRLFVGPGVEFAEEHNDWMLRAGVGYEFELSDRWTLAPEFAYDIIESGKRTYIFGLALGRSF